MRVKTFIVAPIVVWLAFFVAMTRAADDAAKKP